MATKKTSRRLLLIEDHHMLRHNISRLLGMHGYEVHAAGSVADAVELGHRVLFDVALSDYHLLDGTGAQAISRIRETQNLPAVLFTSDPAAVPDDDRNVFVQVFVKPTPIETLVAGLNLAAGYR